MHELIDFGETNFLIKLYNSTVSYLSLFFLFFFFLTNILIFRVGLGSEQN